MNKTGTNFELMGDLSKRVDYPFHHQCDKKFPERSRVQPTRFRVKIYEISAKILCIISGIKASEEYVGMLKLFL